MSDNFYPTTDASFLNYLCGTAPNVEAVYTIGNTFVYVLEGTSPAFKRTLYVRATSQGTVDYYASTYIALRLHRMPELLKWWEQNRNWKDGAYVV